MFGDVSLSKNQVRKIHDVDQNPGAGGWPTVRYFNKGTGYGGAPYKQKTDKAMCDELGPKEDYMQQLIEDEGGTSLCNINKTDKGCSDKQVKFIEKQKDKSADEIQKQLDRLTGMRDKDGASMKPEALAWVKQRIGIFKQFAKGKEEL